MPNSRLLALRWIGPLSLLLATLAVAGRFLELHALLAPPAAPTLAALVAAPQLVPPPGFGWWSWLDQHFYLQSALAWAQGDLSPALHWYPPGYALLGAAFSHVTPADPFMLPDLLCLLGALWLFAAVGAQLIGARFGGSLAAWLFVATTAVPKQVMTAWVVPWTTTPATPCLLACVLATVRLTRRPAPADGFVAGLAAAATLAFRPADAAVVGGVCAVVAIAALVARWPGRREAGRIVAAAVAGAALPVAGFGAAYLAVSGLRPDGYLVASADFGFEWRLLPLRWIILMVDPQPLFIDGQGLAQVFPWIVTGLAGMAACLWRPTAPRLAHAALVGAVLADVAQFLCYRDLHPDYLWQNGVYHYFKWTLPVFALYTALLLRALLLGPRVAPALALAAVLPGLFAWRLTLADGQALPLPADARSLALPHGLSHLDDVVLARTRPGQTQLIPVGTELRTQGHSYRSSADFKLTPWSETLMVQPLRAMPAAPATLVLAADSYALDPAVAPVLARVRPVWGWPCWFWPERRACQSAFLLPAPELSPGRSVGFGTGHDGEVYRLAGLATSEPDGDWTDGPHASLSFRLPPGAGGPFTLELTAIGFAPTGVPSPVTLYANGVPAGQMAFGRDASTQHGLIPAAAIGPDGNVQLDIAVADPRTPTRYTVTSDTRALGIRIMALRLAPVE